MKFNDGNIENTVKETKRLLAELKKRGIDRAVIDDLTDDLNDAIAAVSNGAMDANEQIWDAYENAAGALSLSNMSKTQTERIRT